MLFVLDIHSQETFLDTVILGSDYGDPHINSLAKGCQYYEHEIYGNCYFLAKSLITKQKRDVDILNYLESTIFLSENTGFSLELIDAGFIDYLLSNDTSKTSIEDTIHQSLENYLQ